MEKTSIITGLCSEILNELANKMSAEEEAGQIAILTEADTALKATDLTRGIHLHTDNILNTDAVRQKIEDIYLRFRRIDFLINCVGGVRVPNTFVTDPLFAANILMKICFNVVSAVSGVMIKQGFGRIVNIILPVFGSFSDPTNYAIKGGVSVLTRTAALELGRRGINVNAISAEFLRPLLDEEFVSDVQKEGNRRIPLRRIGTMSDLASSISFFLSKKSSFITGQTLSVCGGGTIGMATI